METSGILYTIFFFHKGCGLNYHKRCVVKVPNNCSRVEDTRRASSHLHPPRSPSANSNNSGASNNDDAFNSSNSIGASSSTGSTLVRKMQQLMNDITN